jgi:hypothetical protein
MPGAIKRSSPVKERSIGVACFWSKLADFGYN